MDGLTKSAHFILVKSTYSVEHYARIFIDEMLCRHEIPLSILMDRAEQLTSRLGRSFQEGLVTKVKLSTAFYPKTDSQEEHTIQTLEDMLGSCIVDFKGNLDNHLPLVEFAYNNSFCSSISMASYEALYGKRCRYPIAWVEVGEPSLLDLNLIYKTFDKFDIIRNRL